jgi:hypothetical protein
MNDTAIESGEGAPAEIIEDGDTVRLAAGIGPGDLAVARSECGQYLLITCREALVAMYGAMGGSVEAVEFADGDSYSVEELLDVIAEA